MQVLPPINQHNSFGARPNSAFLDPDRAQTPYHNPQTPQGIRRVTNYHETSQSSDPFNSHSSLLNLSINTQLQNQLKEKSRQAEKNQLTNLQAHKLLQFVNKNDTIRIEKFCLYANPSVINAVDPLSNQAALHVCAMTNNVKMCEYILKNCKSVNPNIVDKFGRTPLMLAAEQGNIEIIQLLLKGSKLTNPASAYIVDMNGRDVFCYATTFTTSRHKAITEILAENKQTQDKIKSSLALLELVKKGMDTSNSEYALDLIKYGSNVNLIDARSGKSVLMFSCENTDERVTRCLLNYGADPDHVEPQYRNTAGHYAAQLAALECIQALNAAGADLSLVNKRNDTIVHAAAKAGANKVIKYLCQRGCDPTLKNSDKKTARMIAKDFGKKLALKELRRAEKSWAKFNGDTPQENPIKLWQIKLYDWIYDTERTENFRKILNMKADLMEKDMAALSNNNPMATDTEGEGMITPAKDKKKGKKGKKKEVPDKKVLVSDVIELLEGLEPPISNENFNTLTDLLNPKHTGTIGVEEFLGGKLYLHKSYWHRF